jgi:hypothetical protein
LCLLWGGVQALPLAGLWSPAAGLVSLVPHVLLATGYIVLLVRFGLLALVAAFLFGGLSKLGIPSLDPASPLFGVGAFVAAVALALAAYGFRLSLVGSRRLISPTTSR